MAKDSKAQAEESKKSSSLGIVLKSTLGLTIVGVVIVILNFESLFLTPPPKKGTIGVVKIKDGNVRIKYPGSVNWYNLSEGDFVRTNSMVFSSMNSKVAYLLIDGTAIHQDQDTLLKLNFKFNKNDIVSKKRVENINLQLSKGSVTVSTTPPDKLKAIKNIKLGKNTFKVSGKNSLIKVDRNEDAYSLAVIEGEVNFVKGEETVKLKRGDKISEVSDRGLDKVVREKVPSELLDQYDQEIKEQIEHEKLQEELAEARKLSNIIRRILQGIFD
ncbi:MAG: FecR domain-containing protein [Bacteriovoracaceae bacterium]